MEKVHSQEECYTREHREGKSESRLSSTYKMQKWVTKYIWARPNKVNVWETLLYSYHVVGDNLFERRRAGGSCQYYQNTVLAAPDLNPTHRTTTTKIRHVT